MVRTWIAAGLILLSSLCQEKPVQEIDGAKAAKALLDRVGAKVKAAKSIRIAFKITQEAGILARRGDSSEGLVAAEVLVRSPGEVRVTMIQNNTRVLQLRGDGKVLVVEGDEKQLPAIPSDPKTVSEMARRMALKGFVSWGDNADGVQEPAEPGNLFIGGREKVDGVETQLVAYDLKSPHKELDRISVRAWIDPVKLVVVKREYDIRAFCRVLEVVTQIAFDEDLPADEFALQSPRLVRGAVEGQVARSIEIYARFMGRLPERLEDLDAPSKGLEAGSFWPEGGFWIGGKRPSDLAYSVSGGVAKLGAQTLTILWGGRVAPSTERLKQFYSARVRLQLVQSAVEAWHRAYSRLPEKIEDLTTKPEGIDFWPEGGFVGAAQVKDPWGEGLTLSGDKGRVVVACAGSRRRVVRFRQLTEEESRALRGGMFEAQSPEARKRIEGDFDGLKADDIEIRHKAMRDLLAMSLPALPMVEDRLNQPAGGMDMAILKAVRDRLQALPQTWRAELRGLKAEYLPGGRPEGSIESNERQAITALKTVTTAQADFRANDRDNNRVNDFWVRDLAGLYGLVPSPDGKEDAAPGKADSADIIKLIEPELAAADATKGRRDYPQAPAEDPEPFGGYYFVALKFEVIGGKAEVLDDGKGRNADCFGFLAYPAEYGITGKRSFIVNEDNTIWCQDLEGREVDTFPGAPPSLGWTKVD